METISIITYIIYSVISALATVLLGRNLYKNGEVFLYDIFKDSTEYVKPINNLLLTGFYILNLGFILVYLTSDILIQTLSQSVVFLSNKIGTVLLVLGSIHFFNVNLFLTIKSKRQLKQL